MRFIGIDYSMTSPAFTVLYQDGRFITHFFASTKKQEGLLGSNLVGHPYDYTGDSSDFARYHFLAQWFMEYCAPTTLDKIAIEGYSMGSVGAVFNIAENTGVLKHRLFQEKIEWMEVPPSTLKKHATGKGNADKLMMYEKFVEITSIDPRKMLDSKARLGSPFTDIADSYHLANYVKDKISNSTYTPCIA